MSTDKIAPAFVKAKREFSPALKSSTNPHFRSKYADLGACLEAVNDALLNNGIAVYQETFEDQTGVTVETVFLHESGQSLRAGKLHVPSTKGDPQGYGSALTYCRRYSLMAACGIAPEDDDGNAASRPNGRMGGSARDVLHDAEAALDDEQRAWIGGIAAKLHKSYATEGAHRAAERLIASGLEAEQEMALWSMLSDHAKMRREIKEAKAAILSAPKQEAA